MSGELLNPPGLADAAEAAEHARERVEIAINAYIEQYVRAPYASTEFMRRIDSILNSRVGRLMLTFSRSQLLAHAARAALRCAGAKKSRRRPPTPVAILEQAAELACWEHSENGKPFTVEGAYQSASDRLRQDFGIDYVGAHSIKRFREQKNKN